MESRDIVHIKSRLGPVKASGKAWVLQPVFWVMNSVPILAWAGVLAWRRRKDAYEANPKLQRRRETELYLTRSLEELRTQAAAGDATNFYATLFHSLQELFGDRLDLPSSSITEAVVEERLNQAGGDDALRELVAGVFHRCNSARFGGGDPSDLNSEIEALNTINGKLQGLEELS